MFALSRTASHFFQRYKKYINFFFQKCKRRVFLRKWKIKKKTNQKIITNEKLEEKSQVYYRNLSEDEKIKKSQINKQK